MAVKLSTDIDQEEWQFFLTGGINLNNPLKNKISWLQDKSWDELCRLRNLPKYKVNKLNLLVANIQVPILNIYCNFWDTFLEQEWIRDKLTEGRRETFLKCLYSTFLR